MTVSDEEARSFYEQNRSAFQQPEKTMSFEEVEAELTGVLRREKIKLATEKYLEDLRKTAEIQRF